MNSYSSESSSCTAYNGQLQCSSPVNPSVRSCALGTPFGDYVGKSLDGYRRKYHIDHPSYLNYEDLAVFSAISYDGVVCEAQFFKKCILPDKLYSSRKRRIQRLKRSDNLMDELDRKDVRILISRIPQDNARNCGKYRIMDTEVESQSTYSEADFPPFCPAGKEVLLANQNVLRYPAKNYGIRRQFPSA